MFDIPLAQLPISLKQKAIFRRAGLATPSEVLLPPRELLVKTLKPCSKQEVDEIVRDVAKALCPKPIRLGADPEEAAEREAGPSTAKSKGKVDVLSFGDNEIDALLGGGIRKGMITELVGESASGKSNLSLLLALTSQLPSLHPTLPTTYTSSPTLGSIAYLSSEGKHPSHSLRLQSLAAGLLARHPQDPALGITIETLTSNIYFDDCHDVEGLDHTLSYRIPALIERLKATSSSAPSSTSSSSSASTSTNPTSAQPQPPLHLLILDSLTALIRTTYPTNHSSGLSSRAASLCSLSSKLLSLATTHRLAILVINQVSDIFYNPFHSYSDHPDAEGVRSGRVMLEYRDQARWFNGSTKILGKEAALGLVWANCVNARVMLSRTWRNRRVELPKGEGGCGGEEGGFREKMRKRAEEETSLVRRMEVVFGSGMQRGKRDYVVWEEGVWGLEQPPMSPPLRKKRLREEEEGEGGEEPRGEKVRRGSSQSQGAAVDEVDIESGQGEGADEEDEFGYGDDAWMTEAEVGLGPGEGGAGGSGGSGSL